MMNAVFARSAALLDPERCTNTHVAVYGLGAVGSWASLVLNKMGLAVHGFDFDVVSEENLGPQLFEMEDVGKSKAGAVRDNVYMTGPADLIFSDMRVDRADPECTVHVLAMDNMEARRAVVKTAKDGDFIIDCRMGATNLHVRAFYVSKTTKKEWLKDWFPQREAEELPCTAKATVWNATMCASHVARYVYLYLRGEAKDYETVTGTQRIILIEGM